MPALAPRQIAAVLWQVGLRRKDALRNLTAIALAESGGEVGAIRLGSRRGLWLINDERGFDRHRMVTDAAYAAARAVEISRKGELLSMWPSWTNGRYKTFLNAAAQAETQAAAVTGSILAEDGSYVPASFYANAAPVAASPVMVNGLYDPQTLANRPPIVPSPAPPSVAPPPPGRPVPLAYQQETTRPLEGLRITGTEITGDFASIVVGEPEFSAGMGEIPNLTFTLADSEGDLLWQKRNLWVPGSRITYMDLDLRLDEHKFEPGPSSRGAITITAVDALVFALQRLRGARVAKNVSPTQFIRDEVRLAGFDPNLYYLGENLPVQAQIARDVPTEQQSGSDTQDPPSAWTTITRLAKDCGRRAFISGRKLVFGSVNFARDWCSTGDLRIGWHSSPEGERWLTMPSAQQNSGGSTSGGTTVSGKVPLGRAKYFRPGVCVIVHHTPSIAAGDRRMVCSGITHTLGRDTDGADIELMDPVDPKVEKK